MGLKKLLSWFTILIICISCGATDQEEIDDKISEARQFLTEGQCQKALDTLGKIPYQTFNVDFIESYASAQACLGGYSTVNFFANDLGNLATAQDTFLGSLSTFSTSNMTTTASSSYLNIKAAIETLILAGGVTSSSFANRSVTLGATANKNISVFALYLSLVELGKFLNYYGNADDVTGVKGDGGPGNGCYLNYTDAQAIAGIGLETTDSCDQVNEGHPDLDLATESGRIRACEGIVLFNNMIDIITNVTFSGSNSGNLGSLGTTISNACSAGAVFNAATCETKTFSECVSNTTDITDAQIERFYGIILENMHQ